ncbi:MAG: hypothetical protein IKC11_02465 [Clostridia bacterium]|nr:hypothetical protein [Clostridia bacterium]
MEKERADKLKKMIYELAEEASNGCVKIGEGDLCWKFYSKFFTKINGVDNTKSKMYHTLVINNLDEFVQNFEEYLITAREFYQEDKWYYDVSDDAFDKMLLLNLVVNAGVYDFHDFIPYMQTRKKLLNHTENIGTVEFGEYKNFFVSASIERLPCNLEAPYKFTASIRDRFGGEFVLPSVVYGTSGDIAYVYAVQGVNGKQTSKVAKDMDRYFRKFNKDVDSDEAIANVSPNALASVTLFNSFLKKRGIDKMVATEFMPVRYQSNKSSIYIKGEAKKLSKEEVRNQIEKHDYIQHNITDKFMYVLMRYCHHFDGADFEYDDIKHRMKVVLGETKQKQDNVIYELEDLVLGEGKEKE